MLNRRGFLGLLQGLPWVGAMFGQTAKADCPKCKGNLEIINRLLKLQVQSAELLPGAGGSLASWVSVKDRRPQFGEDQFGEKLVVVETTRPVQAERANIGKWGKPRRFVCLGRLSREAPDGTWEVQLPPSEEKIDCVFGIHWLPFDGPRDYHVTHWAERPAFPEAPPRPTSAP